MFIATIIIFALISGSPQYLGTATYQHPFKSLEECNAQIAKDLSMFQKKFPPDKFVINGKCEKNDSLQIN